MEGYTYYNVRKAPFTIHGLDKTSETTFHRIPEEIGKATSGGVHGHGMESAGGRIRFRTNSDSVVIKVKMVEKSYQFFYGSAALEFGFDVYVDKEMQSIYMGCTNPAATERDNYESQIYLGAGEKDVTVYMPLYGKVESVEIGLKDGSTVGEHTPYKYKTPIVYYGSSITQGAFSIRPGLAYEAIISRKLNYDYVNLGFAGACKGEDTIVDYIAGLEMSAFVLDYDHNAPNIDHLKSTHYKTYEKIRAAHPDIPIYMLTRPAFQYAHDTFLRRCVVMESYIKAYTGGDKNVYYIDGAAFSVGTEINDFTPDRCHPDNYGLRKMAEVIGDAIAKTVDFEKLK